MKSIMKIYCDTNTLFSNIKNLPVEIAALERLLEDYRAGKNIMLRSRVDLREVMKTPCTILRQKLIEDYECLQPVPNDEKLHGFNKVTDYLGGCFTYPLISDVQDEVICAELEKRGLRHQDAQHITQAICNGCDIFLTRDFKTIIKDHRTWLEARFPNFKVRKPSEMA